MRRRLAVLKRDLKDGAKAAAGPGGRRRVRTVNIPERRNIVVAVNVGEHGARQGASSIQHARIRQRNCETGEESETVETRLDG